MDERSIEKIERAVDTRQFEMYVTHSFRLYNGHSFSMETNLDAAKGVRKSVKFELSNG